jgi:hypothetical protein
MKKLSALAVVVAALAGASGAHAAVSTATLGSFGADAWAVNFATAASNPVFQPSTYGGAAGDPSVSIRGWFEGQQVSTDPAVCGAAPRCVIDDPASAGPTDPLTLDASSQAQIGQDLSRPGGPNNLVVVGNPAFLGPIAIHFSQDVLAVGFDLGVLNGVGVVRVTAYDRAGGLLYSATNGNCTPEPGTLDPACTDASGIEFFGMADYGSNTRAPAGIAGVLVQLSGADRTGFSLDNLIFRTTPVPPTPVPAPGSLALIGLALAAAGLVRRRKA